MDQPSKREFSRPSGMNPRSRWANRTAIALSSRPQDRWEAVPSESAQLLPILDQRSMGQLAARQQVRHAQPCGDLHQRAVSHGLTKVYNGSPLASGSAVGVHGASRERHGPTLKRAVIGHPQRITGWRPSAR